MNHGIITQTSLLERRFVQIGEEARGIKTKLGEGADRLEGEKRSATERFWSKVQPNSENGCWEWKGQRNYDKYGKVTIKDLSDTWTTALVHRLSWCIHNGPIPDGIFVCHKCDNRPCCNPGHLFLGTNMDNMRDMYLKGRLVSGRRKITNAQIEIVRSTPKKYGRGVVLGKLLGVSPKIIANIWNGVTWNTLSNDNTSAEKEGA